MNQDRPQDPESLTGMPTDHPSIQFVPLLESCGASVRGQRNLEQQVQELKRQHEELDLEFQALKQQHESLHKEHQELERQHEGLHQEHREQVSHVERAQAAQREAESLVQTLQSSSSWRLTAPLRRFLDAIRGRR